MNAAVVIRADAVVRLYVEMFGVMRRFSGLKVFHSRDDEDHYKLNLHL